MNDVTRILQAINKGDPRAANELIPLVYDELRKLAAARLAHEKPGQTLSATALVHEVFIRLTGESGSPDWNSRGHFFGAAAEAMRRILIENARRKQRVKHGGEARRIELDSDIAVDHGQADELLALDEALDQFATEEPVASQVVKLRYFAGLTIEETAEVLSISVRTANRHWAYAKAWLYDRLRKDFSVS